MKRNFNLFLSIFFVLLLIGCRHDIFNNEYQYTHSVSKEIVELKDVPVFSNYIEKLKNNEDKQRRILSKVTDENKVVIIKKPDKTSYSTIIYNEDSSFDVLVYTTDTAGKELYFKAHYTPTNKLVNNKIDNFTGSVVYSDINSNSTEALYLANSKLADNNKTTGKSSKLSGCTFYVTYIAVRCTAGGNHEPEDTCNGTPDQQPYYEVYISSYCSNDSVADPFSGGGGGDYGDPYSGGGSSGGYYGTSDTPCEKYKSSISTANTLLKNNQVQSNIDAVLKDKSKEPLEYAKKIGRNTDGTYSFSKLVVGTKDMTIITDVALPSGKYVADGHSHAGGFGDPSAGDFYGMLEQLVNNPNFETRLVYGDYFGTPEVYALVLNDRALALDFLAKYPKAENYNTQSHSFLRNSILGSEFFKVSHKYDEGTYINGSDEYYVSPAIGMAYILEKYNVGISIAKADADGNLKKINATLEEIVVPLTNGTVKKEGVKVSKCP